MFAELIATEGVEEIYRAAGPIGVMALHGGLEEGTASIAAATAEATGASLYAVVQPSNLRWHVPSIRYNPADSAALAGFLEVVETAVSLHGYGRAGLEDTALLGGTNRLFAHRILGELTERGLAAIADLDSIPVGLKGLHRLNPVNRPLQAGVQLELPMTLREGLNAQLVVDALAAAMAAA